MGINGEIMTSIIREEIITAIASIIPFDIAERDRAS